MCSHRPLVYCMCPYQASEVTASDTYITLRSSENCHEVHGTSSSSSSSSGCHSNEGEVKSNINSSDVSHSNNLTSEHDNEHDEDTQVSKRHRIKDHVENSIVVREANTDSGSRRLLGIRQVWVHSTRRRQHIAQCLVDSARQYALFGSIVLRSDIAFAQPTTEGKHTSTTLMPNGIKWN